jgi:hypothetical protein
MSDERMLFRYIVVVRRQPSGASVGVVRSSIGVGGDGAVSLPPAAARRSRTGGPIAAIGVILMLSVLFVERDTLTSPLSTATI